MILWLASYPRSGNTFFRTLLKHVYDINSLTIYDQLPQTTWTAAPEYFTMHPHKIPTFEDMVAADEWYVMKTHDLPKEDHPAIYIVRDGRDALISHAHFVLEYDWKLPLEERQARYYDTLRMLIETDVSFGGWGKNVLAWTLRQTPTIVVKFEQLIINPFETLAAALTEIGYQPPEARSSDTPLNFEHLHKLNPQFFRKGRVGAWREEMPTDLQELFWQRHGAVMDKMTYSRD
ncbi:MAG: sulfotransferase domain-containing protein [Anaerolineae bacterium]|nr:sulfotransferase domain-containing protein [Anaerolineae bacterium]